MLTKVRLLIMHQYARIKRGMMTPNGEGLFPLKCARDKKTILNTSLSFLHQPIISHARVALINDHNIRTLVSIR